MIIPLPPPTSVNGAPSVDGVTLTVNEPLPVSLIVMLPDAVAPGAASKFSVFLFTLIRPGASCPMPTRRTVGKGTDAVTVSVPVRVPVVLGVKVTETVHFAPALSELPQVVEEDAKSPLALTLSIVIG